MILASCLEVGVEILYSEDVPGLDAVERLRLINPFAKGM
jgi:predicted nucleic acid-binding protein